MTFYEKSQEGSSYGLGGRLTCLLHTFTLVFVGEKKSRMDTGQGLLTLQRFVFTNKEDQLGPAPTLEASLWTTWKLRLQKSLVCKYHTVIPPSDLTLSSLCLYICKKGHGMAEHLSSEQLKHVACQVFFSAHSLP